MYCYLNSDTYDQYNFKTGNFHKVSSYNIPVLNYWDDNKPALINIDSVI